MQRKAWSVILACIIVAVLGLFAYSAAVFASCSGPNPQRSSGSSTRPPSHVILDDPDLKGKLPYLHLHEGLVQETGLGKADELKPPMTSPEGREGTRAYYWYSQNKSHDLIFAAYCSEHEVVEVARFLDDTDYWPKDQALPDRRASGRTWEEIEAARAAAPTTTPRTQREEPPDPNDYDDPEIYADEAESWFADHGYSNPWGAAHDYWEEMY